VKQLCTPSLGRHALPSAGLWQLTETDVNKLTPKCGETMAGELINRKCAIWVNGS
jgi:hypothetical protein